MFEGNYNSRKFRMGLLAMLLLLTGACLVFLNPLMIEVYTAYVGGIVTLYGVYCGMNVANKWALGKAQGATVATLQIAEVAQDDLPQVQFSEEK